MQVNNINNKIYSPINNTGAKTSNPSFKGGEEDKCLALQKFYKNVADNNVFQKGIKAFSRSNNSFTHILAIESAILSSFYMICTLRNDKIEKEQKPQMLINDTLTLGFSTAGSYLADSKLKNSFNNKVEKVFEKNRDFYVGLGKSKENPQELQNFNKFLDKAVETFSKKGDELKAGIEETTQMLGSHLKNIIGTGENFKAFKVSKEDFSKIQESVKDTIISSKTMDEAKEGVKKLTTELYNSSIARNQADSLSNGLSKLRGLVVFGTIYRFVGPVVFTPVANKLSSKFFPQKGE